MKKKDLRDARERLRRHENREMILHAAEAVILRKGLSATSMDDVAEESQFSKATLYHYFKSKAQLIFEILFHYLEDVDRRFREIWAQKKSVRQRLKESVRYSLLFQAEKENINRVFLMDRSYLKLMQVFVTDQNKLASDAERRFIQKIKAKRREINEGVKELLKEGMASGEFRKMDLQAAVTFLGAVIQGYSQEKFWNESKPKIEEDVSHIETFILRGIENKEGLNKGESK